MKARSGGRRAFASIAILSFAAVASNAQAGAKGTDRPITGVCETAITLLSTPGVFPVILAIDVSCQLSHLGMTVGGTDREVIVPAGPPDGSVLPIYISIERITYVAANGDELWSMFAGPGAIDFATGIATFDGVETYVGGTGRYANATGQSRTAGQGSLVDNMGRLAISGDISYR